MEEINIHIHRRDLRMYDNTAINNTPFLKKPIFIFDPIQIDKNKNKYFSNNLVQFLCESLLELNNEYGGKLQFFYGNTTDVLKDIITKNCIKTISFNKDYSPFSKKRDELIEELCSNYSVKVNKFEDMLLEPIESMKSLSPTSNKPYKVFTPFLKNLMKSKVKKCKNDNMFFDKKKIVSKYLIDTSKLKDFFTKNPNLHVKPGRKEALKILNNIDKFKKYNECRNFLDYKTTSLSAYINLGLLSIRECYWFIKDNLGISNNLITELYWRDFYYNILNYFPHVVGNSFNKNYNIKWKKMKPFKSMV